MQAAIGTAPSDKSGQVGDLGALGERLLAESARIVARMYERIVAEVDAYGTGSA